MMDSVPANTHQGFKEAGAASASHLTSTTSLPTKVESRTAVMEALEDIVYGSVRFHSPTSPKTMNPSLTRTAGRRHRREIHRIPLRHGQSPAAIPARPPPPSVHGPARLLPAIDPRRRFPRSLPGHHSPSRRRRARKLVPLLLRAHRPRAYLLLRLRPARLGAFVVCALVHRRLRRRFYFVHPNPRRAGQVQDPSA